MRIMLLAGIVLAASGAAVAETPGEAFAGLTGFCWKAELGEGNSDTHCFTAAVGGKLVMDVHKVRDAGGGVVYEGVTVYRPAPDGSQLVYDYVNSFGDVLPGSATRSGQELRFGQGPTSPLDVVWTLEADAYEVGSPVKRRFVRVGPAGEGGL